MSEKLRSDFESYLRGQEPSFVELATAPVLKLWNVCVTRSSHVHGERCMTLAGEVAGHQHVKYGARIETEDVVWLDRKHRWARARSRVYRLEGADRWPA